MRKVISFISYNYVVINSKKWNATITQLLKKRDILLYRIIILLSCNKVSDYTQKDFHNLRENHFITIIQVILRLPRTTLISSIIQVYLRLSIFFSFSFFLPGYSRCLYNSGRMNLHTLIQLSHNLLLFVLLIKRYYTNLTHARSVIYSYHINLNTNKHLCN